MSLQRHIHEPALGGVDEPAACPGISTRPEEHNWDQWWRDGAERALAMLAASGEPFTADDLHGDAIGLPDPRHPNHLGALFRGARARGLIEPIGFTVSTNPTRRGGVVRQWRGRPHQVLRTTT